MINASPFSSSSTSSTAGSSANATPSTPSWATSSSSASDPNSPTPKAKKKVPLKWLIAGLGLLLLVVGGGAGFYLMQMNQDVRNQAAGETYGGCSQQGAYRCVDGRQQVCNGTNWSSTNETCARDNRCSTQGQKPADTGRGCCAGLTVGGDGRCVEIGACNSETHCCEASCTYWVKSR